MKTRPEQSIELLETDGICITFGWSRCYFDSITGSWKAYKRDFSKSKSEFIGEHGNLHEILKLMIEGEKK